jgi:hypothetical protein
MTTTEQMSKPQCKHGHYAPSCDQCDSENKYGSKAEELFFKVGSADFLIYAKTLESEVQKLREEIADANENFDAIRNILHDTQAMVAMQSEALNQRYWLIEMVAGPVPMWFDGMHFVTDANMALKFPSRQSASEMFDVMHSIKYTDIKFAWSAYFITEHMNILSTTAETVATWEANKLEPLEKKLAEQQASEAKARLYLSWAWHDEIPEGMSIEDVAEEAGTFLDTVSPAEELTKREAEKEALEKKQVADYEEVLADHRRLVRELDVALNGEAGAAKQASLCDIVSQVRTIRVQPPESDVDQATRLT